jgi:hypothetical protein
MFCGLCATKSILSSVTLPTITPPITTPTVTSASPDTSKTDTPLSPETTIIISPESTEITVSLEKASGEVVDIDGPEILQVIEETITQTKVSTESLTTAPLKELCKEATKWPSSILISASEIKNDYFNIFDPNSLHVKQRLSRLPGLPRSPRRF